MKKNTDTNLEKPQKHQLNIGDVIRRFFFPLKHDFDIKNPIVDEITTTHEYKLYGTKTEKKWTVTGFQCKKCGKIMWLDKYQMEQLPRSMKYGCSKIDL